MPITYSFRTLVVWQKAMLLAEECYHLTEHFPRAEQYGLTSQIRRAVVSIPSNLAEGYCRNSLRTYRRFVDIALGSQAELETQLELAQRLGFARIKDAETASALAAEVGRLLHGLKRGLLASSF
jgi:four helix bundle protein